jgi:asparagine synthase (glutamine-hydrolysing)
MFQFLLLSWNRENDAESAAARKLAIRFLRTPQKWSQVLQTKRALLFCTPDPTGSIQKYILPDKDGIVLGRLFRSGLAASEKPAPIVLDASVASLISSTEGRHLIEHYWGRYVAFVYRPDSDKLFVLRDPSGNLPCFRTTYQGVHIVFSHPEGPLELGLPPYNINWEYIAAHLAFQGVHIGYTGLLGVDEIYAGQCVEFGRDTQRTHLYWDPVSISQSNIIENAAEAVVALRAVTASCVHAWASCYASILHTLSGGIDSSIVLACLRTAPTRPAITCINYATLGPEGDEREFARSVARTVGCELIEEVRDPSMVRLERMLEIRPHVRPWNYRYYVDVGFVEIEIARERGANAIFGGGGGDQIFFHGRAYLAILDYIRSHGLRPHLLAVAWDVSRIEGKSIWSVLRTNVPAALNGSAWDIFADAGSYTSLLADELLARKHWGGRFAHPWLHDTARALPGKAWHAQALSVPQVFYNPLAATGDAESIKPLVSQPLMELCLRIPTYLHVDCGWDRAIARRAFCEDIPRRTITRRSKGGGEEQIRSIVQSNLSFVRAMLLDGQLVGQNLLDRSKLLKALDDPSAIDGLLFGEIEDHLCTEIWLRRWLELARATPQVTREEAIAGG